MVAQFDKLCQPRRISDPLHKKRFSFRAPKAAVPQKKRLIRKDKPLPYPHRNRKHSSAAITQRYIGMEPERVEKAIEGHTQLL